MPADRPLPAPPRRRSPRRALSFSLVALALAACTSQAPAAPTSAPAPTAAKAAPSPAAPAPTTAAPAASPAPKTAPVASPSPATKAAASPSPATKTASPSPAPATKAASPQAAPAGPRTEPRGRAIYVVDFTFVPAYNDPSENQALVTPYAIQWALHDAMIKHLPGTAFAPALAETYEIAPDYKSATFKLREGLKFHNGDPVTSADVKFTFENYKGANARLLKDKTASIETPDARTAKFTFKEPFLDFLVIYGTPASGAGWILPEKYYKQVGPDGFKQRPVGAGPFKFVRQTGAQEIELEAFTDYWRKSPGLKTLILRGIGEGATRVATFQAGEVDLVYNIPAPLIDAVRQQNAQTPLLPVMTNAAAWLEFPGYEKADNPFNKLQVRQAVSFALDRQGISDAESAGFSPPVGNWIPENWPGAIALPAPKTDLAQAKQLMAQAGFPNGFEVESLTPLPPYNSVGERIITQLREIGIRTRLNSMERAAFTTKLTEGPDAFKGIILNLSGAPGDAANRVRAFAICPPKGSSSRTCDPKIDATFDQYEKSASPQEREKLLGELQQYMYDNLIFVPLYRLVNVSAQGPKVANNPDEIFGSIPQWPYLGPYEDVRVKE